MLRIECHCRKKALKHETIHVASLLSDVFVAIDLWRNAVSSCETRVNVSLLYDEQALKPCQRRSRMPTEVDLSR